MAGNIFINYRHGHDPGNTGRLFDRLQEAFRPEQLFIDVDNIAPGLDFVQVLEEQVAKCDVLLAVIGKGWIDARDATGARRLDNPEDFVARSAAAPASATWSSLSPRRAGRPRCRGRSWRNARARPRRPDGALAH
jgi:hypothetical protein